MQDPQLIDREAGRKLLLSLGRWSQHPWPPEPHSRSGVEHVTQPRASQHRAFPGHSDWLWRDSVTQAHPIRVKLRTAAGTSKK